MDAVYTGKDFSLVYKKIEELLKKEAPVIVAIDGMCGSGKSFLAARLEEDFDCNVFHMDEFFLPLEMKTEDRLVIPGENVHYERFREEVLLSLIKGEAVIYRPYLCGLWKYGEPRKVEPKKLTIVEGTYCMHSVLREAYDLKIFLSVNEDRQQERILNRSDEKKLKQFISKWIPLENLYFDELNIRELADILVETTHF